MANKATLIDIFGQGDIPQGSDFANLINSNVNLLETVVQTMLGPLQVTEIDASIVSAANINGINVTTTSLNAVNVNASNSLLTTCDVSANGMNVYCSGNRYTLPVIISAVGTTQAQAQNAQLTTTIVRGQGATDGQATGYSILANRIGWVQYFKYEGTVSANLWPPTGGIINNLSLNNPFPLVAGALYTIVHIAASAYGVK